MDERTPMVQVIKEIHDNAVAHGWWDEARERDEIYALIHSEWSEALEEGRAGHRDVWRACNDEEVRGELACGELDGGCADFDAGNEALCPCRDAKPEGVCIELIDGAIRIMDYMGKRNMCERLDMADNADTDWMLEMTDQEGEQWTRDVQGLSLPSLVNLLHKETVHASREIIAQEEGEALMDVLCTVWAWIKGRGQEPMELLLAKHEYNKIRPIRHGKLF